MTEGAETEPDEVSMDGTNGARILPFPGPSQSGFGPEFSTGTKTPGGTGTKTGTTIPATIDLFGLGSVTEK